MSDPSGPGTLFPVVSGACAIAASVRAGSARCTLDRRESFVPRFALAQTKGTNPHMLSAIARFAQVPDDGPGIGNFWNHSGFGIRFQIIRNPDILSAIVPVQIYGSGAWIIFKWLTVLYVDPQNLMTNRRNRLSGMVSVPREKQCRQQGINNPESYIVSP